MRSQTISTVTPRVTTIVNITGDTVLQFKLSDAKIILADILDKKIVDSLMTDYIEKDILKNGIISLQKSEINKLQQTSENKDIMMGKLQEIINNNVIEVKDLNEVITKQKKEIRKQKFLKVIGYITAVVLPITTIIVMSR